LDVAHAEFDVVIAILVAAEAPPVAVHEVLRHGEKRGSFVEPEGAIGLWGVMSARPGSRHQADELLKQVRKLGFRVRLCSGLFLFHA